MARFSDNWTVRPLPGDHCILRAQNLCKTSHRFGLSAPTRLVYLGADYQEDAFLALNIVTDIAILTVPLPLLWRLRLPIWKRLVLILLLCGGLFVIIMAIVRTILNFITQSNVLVSLRVDLRDEKIKEAITHLSHPPGPSYTPLPPSYLASLQLTARNTQKEFNLWGYRETFFANLAINAPVLSPLFRRAFWKRGPYVGARHWERGAGQQRQQRQQEQQQEQGEEGGLAGAAPRRRRMGVLTSLLEHSSLFASSVVSSLRSRMTGSRDREGEEEDRRVTESHPTAGAATAVSDRNLEAGQGTAEVVAEAQGGDGGGGSGPGEILPSRRSLQVEAYDEKREVSQQEETVGMERVIGEEMVAGSASDEVRVKGKGI